MMEKPLYEIIFLGNIPAEIQELLEQSLRDRVEQFGLIIGDDLRICKGSEDRAKNQAASRAAIYFGDGSDTDLEEAIRLKGLNVPIIPVVSDLRTFSKNVPAELASLNGLELVDGADGAERILSSLLECAGLLREQRKVFVSYRRTESRAAAVQLHDELCARGFDVFLDTHDVRPGEVFQDVLWHRLCDSDMMVMLDTPTYFESKWTKQEIGRARAKQIHVLRVIWPDVETNRMADLAETIYLEPHELEGKDGPLSEPTIQQIVEHVENIRSRSVASRYLSIAGKFRSEVELIGASVEGIGAHRAIRVRLTDGTALLAYPIVGIPTAETLNDVAMKAAFATDNPAPILVYDHVGIRDLWVAHLKWLDEEIKSVRAIKVHEVAWDLAVWERRT